MAHVVVTRHILEEAVAPLQVQHTVQMHEPERDPTEDYLIEIAQEADALITTVADPVTERVLAACPELQIVAQYAVGFDNIDLEAARRHEVIVTHTPGALTETTADFTWALLLALARKVRKADQYVRDGQFARWETTLLLGTELNGKTMGIVGLGRIGQAVARRALGFGMEVTYYNRSQANPTVERQTNARPVSFDALLAESDVISLHCPLNDDSYHLMDAAAFQQMKPSALLVNTARGAVIDEAALVEALNEGALAGAALDVFEEEPAVHPGLVEHDRAVLAPHLGSATVEARTRMGRMCCEAIRAVFERAEKIPHRLA